MMPHWNELTFIWGWCFLLLPLPLLVRYLMRPVEQSMLGALKVPFFEQLATYHAMRKPGLNQIVLLSLSWILLITALARPTWVGDKIPLPVEGRDVMLALDLSGSMRERDLAGGRLNRLDVVKAAADEFISRRQGDRLGLIFFSDRAYLQSPLTFDTQVVNELLKEAQVGLTGQSTAIGDAIAIGIKRLREQPVKEKKDSRVLILLTDGANTAGMMSPIQATALASKIGIKIYTIGVGSQQTSFFGRRNELDEKTLTEIAKATGGKYFRATDAQTLDAIYREIDKLEPVSSEPIYVRPERVLFYYPALVALILCGLLALFNALPSTILRK